MPVLTEGNKLSDVLRIERDNQISRDIIIVLSGQVLAIAAVFGLVSKAQAAAPIPAIAGTGTGVMTALFAGVKVQTGDYIITLLETSATAAFSVVAPDATVLPNGAVGTAYASDHLDFLISDGGTMTLGDIFTVAVTAGGTPVAVGTGDGAVSAFTLGAKAQNGNYKAICKEAVGGGGIFDVIAPDGTSLGDAVVGTAFVNEQINFSVADDTDFIVGDYFNIICAAGSGKAKPISFNAVDGTQDAAGFTYAAYDATDADVEGVGIVRDAVIVAEYLAWPTGTTTAQKASALAEMKKNNIIERTGA